MKPHYLMLITYLVAGNLAFGQGRPDYSGVCRQQMKKLGLLAGHWSGEASFRMGPGPEQVISQEEHVVWKLDSTLLVIEGIGRKNNPSTGTDEVVFNALALLNYDAVDKTYRFRSFLKEGLSTDAYFHLLSENQMEWGFDAPAGGKIRYRITLDPQQKTWNEVGEFSRDGTTWHSFTKLDLKKVE